MESFSAIGSNPLCGDSVTVFIDFDGDRIVDARWEGYGCDLCLKSVDDLLDEIIGRAPREIEELIEANKAQVANDSDIGRTRKKCALLPFEAVENVLSLHSR